MKKYHCIVFGIFLVLGCQNIERAKKPDNLIPEDKMVKVLTEISLMYSARNFNKKLFESTGVTPEEYIYEKFNIDSLQFERSNNFYAENYNEYDRIYSRVKANLDGMKAKLDSVQEETRKMQDSLAADKKEVDSLNVEEIPMFDSIGDPATIKVPENQL